MDTIKKLTELIEDGAINTKHPTPNPKLPCTANFIDAAYDDAGTTAPVQQHHPTPEKSHPQGNA